MKKYAIVNGHYPPIALSIQKQNNVNYVNQTHYIETIKQ